MSLVASFVGINRSSSSLLEDVVLDYHLEMVSITLKSATLFLLVCWTIIANSLVFVVLYHNPRLRTVPNLLVGNLAFSDLCLGCLVLPFSAVYAVTLDWRFGKTVCELWLSCDILVCTASIWNLSMIGLDRYWAITSPVQYLARRNTRFATKIILIVWTFSAAISLAPFIGWKSFSTEGNYVAINGSFQCVHFQDLPSFTIYSAIGSFWIPLIVMFFVYFRIYVAFEQHKIRQMYRQKVIKKHLESTILAELSHVLPTSDEFAKEEEDDDEEEEEEEEDEEEYLDSPDAEFSSSEDKRDNERQSDDEFDCSIIPGAPTAKISRASRIAKSSCTSVPDLRPASPGGGPRPSAGCGGGGATNGVHRQLRTTKSAGQSHVHLTKNLSRSGMKSSSPVTYDKIARHKRRQELRAHLRKSLQRKPKAISAAKEKRGVKVLGIILGCFTVCWTPFFVMYLTSGFCTNCRINAHVEQFITWLGYANSAVNPIIYTVFNKDYQNALKRLLVRSKRTQRKATLL